MAQAAASSESSLSTCAAWFLERVDTDDPCHLHEMMVELLFCHLCTELSCGTGVDS